MAAAAAMFGICATVYLPTLAIFGPYAWGAFFIPPLYFQLSRFGLYLAWFSVGACLGSHDPERGLIARDGALACHWPWWVAAAFAVYNALVVTSLSERGATPAILWVASCVASSFAFLALFCGAVRTPRRWMDSLSRSAYVIYLVHYVYVLWLQRALMSVDVHASLKFLIVLTGAVLFSWLTAQCLLRVAASGECYREDPDVALHLIKARTCAVGGRWRLGRRCSAHPMAQANALGIGAGQFRKR